MEPANVITTVLFDWDGTLFDSAAASRRAFQKMFGEFGIACTEERHDELYAPDWHGMYRALDLPREVWPHADRRWLHHFGEEQPALVEGAAGVLAALAGRGMELGIVSSGTRSRILRELERLGLAKTFGVVVSNEDVANRKPHPEGLERAMRALACPPEACCFVGDTPEDILMGKAAEVLTVAVPSGYVGAGRLAECGPGVLLGHIRELPRALEDRR